MCLVSSSLVLSTKNFVTGNTSILYPTLRFENKTKANGKTETSCHFMTNVQMVV